MKTLIRSATLPMLARIAREAVAPPPRFHSYASALDFCRGGYDSEEIAAVVVEKNKVYQPSIDILATRMLMGLGLSHPSRVLDFGGGGGNHYSVARLVLDLDWCVVETPAMVKAASVLQTDRLRFVSDLSAAGPVDLVFSSGALQYCPDPLAFLERLVELGAPYLYVTRTELTERDESIYTVQKSRLSSNGPGPLPPGFTDKIISYPITYVSRRAFESVLTSRYKIKLSINEEDGYRIGDQSIRRMGYFCVT